MPRLSVVIASTRPLRIGHHVAAWVVARVPEHFDVTVHDLRELDLPFLDEPGQPADGNYAHEHTRAWSAAMTASDALLIVMPEYNRGYNAALKNAIDFLYAEWEGLPVACVGYGWHGAQFAKSALRQTLERVNDRRRCAGTRVREDPHAAGRGQPRCRGRGRARSRLRPASRPGAHPDMRSG
jgi:NAD(P)H-dependent FMN reductase